MKTISKDQFSDFMSDALPELISSIMRNDTSAVSKGQVSLPQFWALHYISKQEGLTVNELAEVLHRGKSSTSALLRRLENSALVKRSRSKKDQRVVRITLTPKGRRLIEQLATNRKSGIKETYATLTASERTAHKRIIQKILSHTRSSIPALLILFLFPLCAQAQSTTNAYTLDESIRIGLKRSLAVVNAAREREIAKATQSRALSDALPKLNGLADYSLYDANNITDSGTRTVAAEATWQIYSGGRTLSAIRAAKAFKELTGYQERRVRETQARDIALAYYAVLLTQAQVNVLSQSVDQLADFEAETKIKYDAGTLSEFDWLSAKVALANERPRLIAAENDLSLAKEQFRNLTYIDDETFSLTDTLSCHPIEVDLEETIALGLRKRPELLEKYSAISLRREDINQQKSDYLPKVNLFGSYNYSNPDPYSFIPTSSKEGWQGHWSAGVRASWSLFDGGYRKSNLSESKLNMAIEEDEYRDLTRSVTLDIRTQWLRGRDAAEVIAATTETMELANRALTIARTRFNAGLSTNLEVTQANLELSDARLSRTVALHAYLTAVTKMKYAVGTLLEEYE